MTALLRRAGLAAAALTLSLGAGLLAPAGALPAWRTTAAHHDATRATRALVVDLRYARHAGFDRVVVDLHGRRPAWSTAYTQRLTYDPSGKPVPLTGRWKLTLTLRPAATFRLDGTNVYDGPRLVRPDLPSLRGIALTGSFEGVTSFGFTSRHKAYRVFTLTDPSRVVIDFRH